MIYINLLPVRKIKKHNRAKKQCITLLLLFFLLLAALTAFVFMQKNIITQKQQSLAMVRTEQKKYAAVIQKIKKLEKEIQSLENRIGIINKLKKSSVITVHAIDEVATLTPKNRMWLTSFNQNGKRLQISGMALDNRTIAQYMDDLKKSMYISNVTLSNSSLKSYAGKNLKAFSIACLLTAPSDKVSGKEQKKK